MTIPTFIPLKEASKRTGWTVERLRELVAAGTIMAGKLPDGDIIVAVDESGTAIETPTETIPDDQLPLAAAGDDINAQLSAIKREDFKHLEGQGITVSEAAKKYNVNRRTVSRWVDKGYVGVSNTGEYPMRVDEADVAYCAAIYAIRKRYNSLAPLLDKDGRPYLLKRPDLARARRLVREQI